MPPRPMHSADIDIIAHIDAMRREMGEEMRLLRVELRQSAKELADVRDELNVVSVELATLKAITQAHKERGWLTKATDNPLAKLLIGIGAVVLAVIGVASNGVSIISFLRNHSR